MTFQIEITNQHESLPCDTSRFEQAITNILNDAKIANAEISVAIVDDETMQSVNREHLQHDYTTDVISFLLEESETEIIGEIIVCSDVAVRTAETMPWTNDDELLLYLIHGMLHLVGYDDLDKESFEAMREAEKKSLAAFGLEICDRDRSAHFSEESKP